MDKQDDGPGHGLTRRRLTALGLGASAALALRQHPAFAAAPRGTGSGPFDVAIIGAGAAGIAAARACIDKNATFVLIEARDRVGGRTHTGTTFGSVIDFGAEWYQDITPNAAGTGTNNPVFDLAVAYSLADAKVAKLLNLQPDLFDRTYFQNGRRLPLTDSNSLAAAATQVLATEAVDEAGRAALKGKAVDISVTQALANAGLANASFIKMYEAGLTTGHGATPDQLGVQDLHALEVIGPGPELPSPFNWKSPYGIGNFIANFLAKGIPVSLKTPATQILWHKPGPVEIVTPAGTIQAKTVVITVPAAVLANPNGPLPKFYPSLPASHLDALAGLPFGYVEKIYLKFSTPDVFTDVKGPESLNTFCVRLKDSTDFRGGEARFWSPTVGSFLVGSILAKTLAKEGKRALIDYAKTTAGLIYGGNPAQFVVGAETSTWSSDTYSQGAYTYAPPGNTKFRKALQQPVSGQLFFAGEAASFFQHSSVPGAWKTGERAAKLAIATVRKTSLVAAGIEDIL